MSKKSKKAKFNKVEITWDEDNSNMLPTVAAAIPQRRDRSFGGFGNYGNYGNNNNAAGPSESDTGKWRRGPSTQAQSSSSSSFNSSSFGANRNSSYMSRNNNQSSSFNSFRSSRSPPNDMNNSNDNNDINASENDRNWRGGKKKEQPKISKTYINSTSSSTSNVNPWRSNSNNNNNNNNNNSSNNNNNNNNNTDMSSRKTFGSKSISEHPMNNNSNNNSFSRNSPRSFGGGGRSNNSSFTGMRSNNSTFTGMRSNNSTFTGQSKFGGSSKFGGGGGGGGGSTSKFASGGGFGATALKNIDNGNVRLSYAKNNRFSGIMDDNKPDKPDKPAVYERPIKNNTSRFNMPSSEAPEQTAFPSLSKPIQPRQRQEKTVEQLNKEIKKDIARTNMANMASMEIQNNHETPDKNKKKNNSNVNVNMNGKMQQNMNARTMENKNSKKTEENKNKKENNNIQNKKQQKGPKVDKKLVRKFNKECLGQNKSIEINNDTEKLILFGLSQKENILKRNEENYEKIANLLCGVILNKKSKIDLDFIYNIIYNKSNLCVEKKEFLALVLEILSIIENKKSCLSVVFQMDKYDMLTKYLIETPNISTPKTMQEFEEYGLQYVYPLHDDIINEIAHMVENKVTMMDIIQYLKQIQSKQIIYSNYKIMQLILKYILSEYYFHEISENEEKNEEIAKRLLMGNGDNDKQNKTQCRQIIELLHCKTDEENENKGGGGDDDDDEEEEEDDEIDMHSVLILSNIISISGALNNNNNGLISVLKVMELSGLIAYKTVSKFVQSDDDKYTASRLNALSKLSDWIAELDARQARIAMEKDNDDYDDENMDNTYAGNLLAQRKHKTASDYETISFVE